VNKDEYIKKNTTYFESRSICLLQKLYTA